MTSDHGVVDEVWEPILWHDPQNYTSLSVAPTAEHGKMTAVKRDLLPCEITLSHWAGGGDACVQGRNAEKGPAGISFIP